MLTIPVTDLHIKILDTPPGPNLFIYMQFWRKFGKIICWCPPGVLSRPPRGNPGSATEFQGIIYSNMKEYPTLCIVRRWEVRYSGSSLCTGQYLSNTILVSCPFRCLSWDQYQRGLLQNRDPRVKKTCLPLRKRMFNSRLHCK